MIHINTLQRAFWRQLPTWAQPTNAVYRYMRTRFTITQGRLWRWLRWSVNLSMLMGLLTTSVVASSQNSPLGLDSPRAWTIYNIFYFPLLVIQFATFALALLSGSGMIANERQRGTWEAYKITSHGTALVIRAHWATIFYQLRWLLIVIMVGRLLFIGLMLVDLTDYQGYHLDLYVTDIAPAVSPELTVVLLAAFMAAALLQIVALIGLSAALGLVIGVLFRQRVAMLVARMTALGIQITLMGLVVAGQQALDSVPSVPVDGETMTGSWLYLLLSGLFGDQGLRFLDLGTFFQTWSDVEYGVWLGAALLAGVLVQVVVTNGLLIWVGRRASRPANT